MKRLAILLLAGCSVGVDGSDQWASVVAPEPLPIALTAPLVFDVGDVNGDGYDDLVYGEPDASIVAAGDGRAQLHLGGPGGYSSLAAWVGSGPGVGSAFGRRVVGLDVNADGFSDLAVAAPGDGTIAPLVVLHLGSAVGLEPAPSWSWTSTQLDSLAGLGLGAGDFDGDGFADLVVGSPGWDGTAGADSGIARVFGGTAATLTSAAVWAEEGQAGEQFGRSVAGLGDLDGDGFGELGVASAAPTGLASSFVALFGGGAAGASTTPAVTLSSSDSGTFGLALAGVGDIDGDGLADALIGEPGFGADAGRVHGVSGGLLVTRVAEPVATGSPGDFLGGSVAGFDVDGDGFADGLWAAHDGTASADPRLELASGGPAGLGAATVVDASGVPGVWLSGGGDGDGDGLPEVVELVGGANAEARRLGGSVAAPGTTPLALPWPEQGGAGFGYRVAGVGDLDADGFEEVAVGAWHFSDGEADEGAVFVFRGGTAGPIAPAAWSVQGDAAGALLGTAIDGAGDINGDGFGDLILGARGLGEAWVFFGTGGTDVLSASADLVLADGQAGASYGHAVAGLGDVDGDGRADVAVGAPLWDDAGADDGRVFVYFGGATPDAVADFEASGPIDSQFGRALAGGDVNGDGLGDLLVGAPGVSNPQADEGAFLLFEASAGSFALASTTESNVAGAELGQAVALGDADGDGLFDVFAGAPELGVGGAVHVWHAATGFSGAPAVEHLGDAAGDGYGAALAVGDADADGRAELLVGAFGVDDGAVEGGLAELLDGPAWSVLGGDTADLTGWSVALADANGDGLADPVIGSLGGDSGGSVGWYAAGSGDSGAVAATPALRAQTAAGAPIAAHGRSDATDSFVLVADPTVPAGCQPVRLVADLQGPGEAFDLADLQRGPLVDSCAGPATVTVTGLAADEGVRVRARLRAAEGHGTTWRAGRWLTLPGSVRTACLADADADGQCNAADLDDDNDGDPDTTDCAPEDPAVSSTATEIQDDGIDQDCSGADSVTCFVDGDGDGVGAGNSFLSETGCLAANESSASGDCDDADADRFPGNPEVCDALDNDCDGALPPDENDGDGDGSPTCGDTPDCDDDEPTVFPGAPEVFDCLDNDCDGALLPNEAVDHDFDGFRACTGEDCDDTNPLRGPGNPEVCDGFDNDCDGELPADEADADADGWSLCAGDCDDADPAAFPGAPEDSDDSVDFNCDNQTGTDQDGDGFTLEDGDCNDGNSQVFPGAEEICDEAGIDNDCDGAPGPGDGFDGDGDGSFGCADCNDADPTVFPGAEEICDGFDTNCDGFLLPGDGPSSDRDADGDGVAVCAGDCDDADAAVHPGAAEDCGNGIDDDCDGAVDAAQGDGDGDGVDACAGDCDDRDPDVPRTEVCDGRDDDCDGVVDQGFDLDGDGVTTCAGDCADVPPPDGAFDPADVYPGAPAVCDDGADNDCDPTTVETADSDGDGFVGCPGGPDSDCLEGDASVFPGAPEACDFRDNDCDDEIDEGLDEDGDGLTTCTGDCVEGNAAAFDGAPEVCDDALDNDCDGSTDEDCGTERLALEAFALPPGCYCDAGGAPDARMGLLLLIVPLLRRQRRR